MQKQCKNCDKTFIKKQTVSLKSWENSKYCSIQCRKIRETFNLTQRIKEKPVIEKGTMFFNGIKYTKEYLLDNPNLVNEIKEKRKLKQKLIRSERLKILTEQRKLLNPKVLKTDEEKKLWQKEYRIKNKKQLFEYSQTDTSKYKQYTLSAKRRNLEFNLTLDQFIKLFHSDCIYCKDEEARGIDRVDNSIGYLVKNCESCCSICNKMKIHYSKEFFINHCKKIANK